MCDFFRPFSPFNEIINWWQLIIRNCPFPSTQWNALIGVGIFALCQDICLLRKPDWFAPCNTQYVRSWTLQYKKRQNMSLTIQVNSSSTICITQNWEVYVLLMDSALIILLLATAIGSSGAASNIISIQPFISGSFEQQWHLCIMWCTNSAVDTNKNVKDTNIIIATHAHAYNCTCTCISFCFPLNLELKLRKSSL